MQYYLNWLATRTPSPFLTPLIIRMGEIAFSMSQNLEHGNNAGNSANLNCVPSIVTHHYACLQLSIMTLQIHLTIGRK